MAERHTGPMAGRTVLVTGGTGGIGKATAEGLARLGARVGIVGRDLQRARSATAAITAATGNPAIDAYAADLSSQAEVHRLAGELLAAYPRLHVLVNNVGGFWASRHVTVDGLERTFAVNHLAPFLLTELLLGRLKASAPARIVTVSSGAHSTGRIDFDDPAGRTRLLRAAGLQPVEAGQCAVHLRAGPPPTGQWRDRHRAAPWHGAHRVRRRRPGTLASGTAAAGTPVHENPRPWRGHPHLPGLLARSRGRHGPILRQPQAQAVQQGVIRHGYRGPAVANQRATDRPPAAALMPPFQRRAEGVDD
jgi:NAD(P)-dependent dehydrogenase (short-subunit alcohol dehydrogenase family)